MRPDRGAANRAPDAGACGTGSGHGRLSVDRHGVCGAAEFARIEAAGDAGGEASGVGGSGGGSGDGVAAVAEVAWKRSVLIEYKLDQVECWAHRLQRRSWCG